MKSVSLLKVLFLCIIVRVSSAAPDSIGHDPFDQSGSSDEIETLTLNEIQDHLIQVQEFISHSYSSYRNLLKEFLGFIFSIKKCLKVSKGFPQDEVKPMSCTAQDTHFGLGLTLIDSLDTLLFAGFRQEYLEGVRWMATNLTFDRDFSVSIFETNIRVVGSLLANHLIMTDPELRQLLNVEDFELQTDWKYTNQLVLLAEELVQRLLKGFETKTGLPVRLVNLQNGIPSELSEDNFSQKKEGHSFAAAELEARRVYVSELGTFLLEFGVLSHLMQNGTYKNIADDLLEKIWHARQKNGLLPIALNPHTGELIREKDTEFTSIGSGIDSYFEYLVKGALLFDENPSESPYFATFKKLEKQIKRYMKQGHWYFPVKLNAPNQYEQSISNLDYFFPSLYLLKGTKRESVDALATIAAYHSLWQQYKFSPEKVDLRLKTVPGPVYNLNPELAEALFYATNFTLFQENPKPPFPLFVTEMIQNLAQYTKAPCGFSSINTETLKRVNRMDTFWIAETCKYLWLSMITLYEKEIAKIEKTKDQTFEKPQLTLGIDISIHILQRMKQRPHVFNTEAHLLWLPEKVISKN